MNLTEIQKELLDYRSVNDFEDAWLTGNPHISQLVSRLAINPVLLSPAKLDLYVGMLYRVISTGRAEEYQTTISLYLNAALQESSRRENSDNHKRSMRYTRISIVVAILALAISGLIGAVSLLLQVEAD